MNIFKSHNREIKNLCEQYHVRTLFAFGSVLTQDFKPNSDVDLVVDIDNNDPITYSEDYFGLKFKLEDLFASRIDLLEQKALKNPYLKVEIEKTKKLVYIRES